MKLAFVPESSTQWSVLQEDRGRLLPAESLLPQGIHSLPLTVWCQLHGHLPALLGLFMPVTLLYPPTFPSPVSLLMHPKVAPVLLPRGGSL